MTVIDFGPLQPLIDDPDVQEIMVNAPDSIFIWHHWHGREQSSVRFNDESHLRQTIEYILAALDQQATPGNPVVESRLPDGSRMQVVIPPVSPQGAVLYISRPAINDMTLAKMVEIGAISQPAVDFLLASIQARANILVYGSYRGFKSHMLNALAQHLHPEARVIVIQESSEINLPHANKVMLETRPANLQGEGAITMRQLFELALKFKPDRLVLCDLQDDTALPLLSALNIGYSAMWTLYATTPREAIAQLEMMASTASLSLPLLTVREQIASGVNLLVQLDLMDDGFQRTIRITEVQGLRGEDVVMEDIFTYQQTGSEPSGKYIGSLAPTGSVPRFAKRIRAWGIELGEDLFKSETQ